MKKRTILLLVGLAIFIFLIYVVYVAFNWNKMMGKVNDNRISKQLEIYYYEGHSCPPNLSNYKCETFIRFALVNGIDIDDFLLSRWKN